MTTLTIRPATRADDDAIWNIVRAVIATGDTWTFDPQAKREDALAYWFSAGTHPYVAESEGRIEGTYFLRPNQAALGAHVANGGFMVAPEAHGRGIGRRMGEHFIGEAKRMGFRAMQFNFVVSTNEGAVHLWQDLGFQIIGTLPGAFRHAKLGYVDAYVMYQVLEAGE